MCSFVIGFSRLEFCPEAWASNGRKRIALKCALYMTRVAKPAKDHWDYCVQRAYEHLRLMLDLSNCMASCSGRVLN